MHNAHIKIVNVQFCLVGMKAVCSGPEGCKYNNEENCVVTPLSTTCYQPMWDLNNMNI